MACLHFLFRILADLTVEHAGINSTSSENLEQFESYFSDSHAAGRVTCPLKTSILSFVTAL